MILFKVNFKNNAAIAADATAPHRPAVQWKENPYALVSIDVWANNTVHAVELAQAKASVLLKEFH